MNLVSNVLSLSVLLVVGNFVKSCLSLVQYCNLHMFKFVHFCDITLALKQTSQYQIYTESSLNSNTSKRMILERKWPISKKACCKKVCLHSWIISLQHNTDKHFGTKIKPLKHNKRNRLAALENNVWMWIIDIARDN